MGKTKTKTVTLDSFETWDHAKLVPIDKLVIPEWNINEMTEAEFAALVEEIQDGNFDEPCQVVPIQNGPHQGGFLVLGGAHRVKACTANGFSHVPCVLKEHLTGKDELELEEWSAKRNNIRGRLNAQKYADLERRMTGRWQISAEAARRRMLMRQEVLDQIKTRSIEEIDVSIDESGKPAVKPNSGEQYWGDEGELERDGDDRPRNERPETDGSSTRKQKFAERRALLANLKQFVQEVLAESQETVEQGYLYFGQGGNTHLVVNESRRLHALISEMVATCQANSDRVEEFLISAITKELPQWQ